MKFFRCTLFMVAMLFGLALSGQETVYSVYIGTFVNAKSADFESLRDYGFVYAQTYSGNLRKIYLGGFTSREKAEKVLAQVQNVGYPDSFISAKKIEAGKEVAMIQLGLTSSTNALNWEPFAKAGPLFVQLLDENMKIMTGPFSTPNEARNQIVSIKKSGFQDAFVKVINENLLVEVTAFEATMLDGSPVTIPEKRKESAPPSPVSIPRETETPTVPPVRNAGATPSFQKPDSHSKVKRTSVLALQTALKEQNSYFSNLDGIYGWGTSNGFDKYVAISREWEKYKILAQQLPPLNPAFRRGEMESHIMDIPNDPQRSENYFRNSSEPVAKAWLAYLIFRKKGWCKEIDDLMNQAIKSSFNQTETISQPAFDPRFSYSYKNLEQLILHLRYIQETSRPEPATPCWLFEQHPQETSRVFADAATMLKTDFKVTGCDRFLEWEELKVLLVIASEMSRSTPITEELLRNQEIRMRLFVAPRKLNPRDAASTGRWNDSLWSALTPWGQRDPLHKKMLDPFRIAFFQSLLLLEDYFMQSGISYKDAELMGLSVLKSIVDPYLISYYE